MGQSCLTHFSHTHTHTHSHNCEKLFHHVATQQSLDRILQLLQSLPAHLSKFSELETFQLAKVAHISFLAALMKHLYPD